MNGKKWIVTATAAALLTGSLVAPVSAQSSRQKDKNTMRNLGIGLGAGAVYEAINGRGTNALILGAGAAYSAKKYEDARKAQNKENAYRNARWYSNEYRNGKRVSYKKHSGKGKGHAKHGCR